MEAHRANDAAERELMAVRLQLDRYVAWRLTVDLSPSDQAEYRRLSRREDELLRTAAA